MQQVTYTKAIEEDLEMCYSTAEYMTSNESCSWAWSLWLAKDSQRKPLTYYGGPKPSVRRQVSEVIAEATLAKRLALQLQSMIVGSKYGR